MIGIWLLPSSRENHLLVGLQVFHQWNKNIDEIEKHSIQCLSRCSSRVRQQGHELDTGFTTKMVLPQRFHLLTISTAITFRNHMTQKTQRLGKLLVCSSSVGQFLLAQFKFSNIIIQAHETPEWRHTENGRELSRWQLSSRSCELIVRIEPWLHRWTTVSIGSRQITSIVKRHSTGTNSTRNLLFFLLSKFLLFSSHNLLLLCHFFFALTKGFLIGLGNFGWSSRRTSLRRYRLVHGETVTAS
mmetsp:Transcript_9695/g.22798  ORF Transcript_9695/g.22798 Transcript_9695/m.22798 type:complete len:243 (+) Transcript_9695:12061-12789(+)